MQFASSKRFLPFLLFFFVSYSWVSSVLMTDTVFHRLNCHHAFRLATPHKASRLEKAMIKCGATYRNSGPKNMDCLNFCIAKEIRMIAEPKTGSRVEFNKADLGYALDEWLAGEGGPTNVKAIVDGFQICMKQYSTVTLTLPNCKSDVNGKSNQTALWLCFKNKMPCEVIIPTTRNPSIRTYMSKFDRADAEDQKRGV